MKNLFMFVFIFTMIFMAGCTIMYPVDSDLLPDLEVIDIDCAFPDGVLSFTVKNKGLGQMPAFWRFGSEVTAKISLYYAELDADILQGEMDLRVPAVMNSDGGIDKPGGVSVYNSDIIIGWTNTVKVEVDTSHQIEESNEENNSLIRTYFPCGLGEMPDLVVDQLSIRASPAFIPGVEDFDQWIAIMVQNRGKRTANGTENHQGEGYIIDFVLSSDESIPENPTIMTLSVSGNLILISVPMPTSYRVYQEDMLIGRISLTEDILGDGSVGYRLARYLGGEVISVPSEFPTVEWEGWADRTFYLYAIIDPLFKVNEAFEDNNIFHIPFRIERPLN
jgi:hypothetical protein